MQIALRRTRRRPQSRISGEGGRAIKLFIAGVRDWEADLQRILAASAERYDRTNDQGNPAVAKNH